MAMVFQQANESFKSFSLEDKEAVIHNLVESLMFIEDDIQDKVIENITLINEELADTIRKLL